MRRPTLAAVPFVLVAAFAAPATVNADRPATPEESAAILGAASPAPAGCYEVTISTADPAWALTVSNPDAAGYDDACELAGNGRATAHLVDGRWTMGRSEPADGDGAPCRQVGVPDAVGTDLGICRSSVPAGRTTLTCWGKLRKIGRDRWKWPRRDLVRPKSCDLPGRANAEAVILSRIRWSSWGSRVAKATATSHAIHGHTNSRGKLVFDKWRVRLRASQPTEWDGKRWYQKLTIYWQDGKRKGRYQARVNSPWAERPED